MADPTGFLKYKRELPDSRAPKERKEDYKEIYKDFPEEKLNKQASRCMDCGTPFCHSGCPLGNVIPDFNDAVYQENWEEAYRILSETNNFPEFTGRICPAPCESKCVLGINQPPVAIELIEKTIIETAFKKGLVQPSSPLIRTGKKVAIVGSGPAGLAAASELNKDGHSVTVFERNSRIGGLLRYGIPDFKLEKWVIDRRIKIMEAEGIKFEVNAYVGRNVPVLKLMNEFDAIVLCGGSTIPRNLKVKGEGLNGVHFAMEFLEQSNKRVAGDTIPKTEELLAELATASSWGTHEAKVDIYLYESMIDKAIAVVNDISSYRDNLVHKVMNAAIADHPDWVISNACRRAESIMNEGKAKYYEYAIAWLKQVRAAYIASERQREWSEYREKIVSVHGRKRKLMGLMKSLV